MPLSFVAGQAYEKLLLLTSKFPTPRCTSEVASMPALPSHFWRSPMFASDHEYEAATLAYWQSREDDFGDVTVTVRNRAGRAVRLILLRPSAPPATIIPSSDASADFAALAGEASPRSTASRTPR